MTTINFCTRHLRQLVLISPYVQDFPHANKLRNQQLLCNADTVEVTTLKTHCFLTCSETKNRHLNYYCYISVISFLRLTYANTALSLFAFLVTLY